jgi:hypothetical protein
MQLSAVQAAQQPAGWPGGSSAAGSTAGALACHHLDGAAQQRPGAAAARHAVDARAVPVEHVARVAGVAVARQQGVHVAVAWVDLAGAGGQRGVNELLAQQHALRCANLLFRSQRAQPRDGSPPSRTAHLDFGDDRLVLPQVGPQQVEVDPLPSAADAQLEARDAVDVAARVHVAASHVVRHSQEVRVHVAAGDA